MFSLGDLLDSGTEIKQGLRHIASAADTVSKVRSDVGSMLAQATPPSGQVDDDADTTDEPPVLFTAEFDLEVQG